MRVFNYNHLKQAIGGYLEIKSPQVFRLLNKHKIGVKYVFSGGLSALVNLFFLYVLTDIFGIWYLISSIIAFIFSTLASFFLQKLWTFRDNSWRRAKKQMAIYIVIGISNFILNPILLYTLVEKFHIWYLLAAAVVMGSLAMINYLINKFITFKKDILHESINV